MDNHVIGYIAGMQYYFEKPITDLPISEVIDPAYTRGLEGAYAEQQEALKDTRELLIQTTRNLGNPAYGQSTATTMAIDELREKAFNFLGIPKE